MEIKWISKSDVKRTRVKLGKEAKALEGKGENNRYDVTFLSNVEVRRVPKKNGGRTDKQRDERKNRGRRKEIDALKK